MWFRNYGKTYEELEKSNHPNRAEYVSDSRHDCTKPHAARVEHWPKEQGDKEEDK